MSPRYCSPSTRMSMPISSWNRIHSRVAFCSRSCSASEASSPFAALVRARVRSSGFLRVRIRRVDHSEAERLRRSVFREDGPRRGPLDQIESEDVGGHLLEILVDPCDVPEEGEEGQGRLRLVPPDAIEALGDKAQV